MIESLLLRSLINNMQRLNYCLGIDQVRQGCRGKCLFTLIQRPTVLCKCVNYTILERVLLISHLFQSPLS